MSEWDELDKELAQAVGDLLRQPLWWQPMLGQGAARERVNRKFERDPNRTGRWAADAIVTFRTKVVEAGGAMDVTDRGSVLGFDLVVDLDPFDFEIDEGVFELPRAGDVFDLVTEFEGNRFFTVEQDTNDGSARLIYYCQTPRQSITNADMDPNRGSPP